MIIVTKPVRRRFVLGILPLGIALGEHGVGAPAGRSGREAVMRSECRQPHGVSIQVPNSDDLR
jgi:hypothetical protein